MSKGFGLQEVAKGCLRLAEVETHPEVRTILMGMTLGWLQLAKQMNSSTAFQQSRSGEIA
jgi:hypothetical protein